MEALRKRLSYLLSPLSVRPFHRARASSGFSTFSVFNPLAGPLSAHQLLHMWLDLRGIQDDFMRTKGIDYFENSRRATLVQQQYAIRNPRRFTRYGEYCWRITPSEWPATLRVNGIEREFLGYAARGVPEGPDDGTIALWVVIASLPFAPEIVVPRIRQLIEWNLREMKSYGFKATFNATFRAKLESSPPGSPPGTLDWTKDQSS